MKGKRLDLTGKRFGKLLGVAKTGTRLRGYSLWTFQCDCGNVIERPGAAVVKGSPKSCGCWMSQEQRKRMRKRPFESIYNYIARRPNSTLTYEEFIEFTKYTKCHYCRDDIFWATYRSDKNHQYNLDRKDPKLGYTKDNCVVCCWPCNRMKFTYTYDEFIDRCKRIARGF